MIEGLMKLLQQGKDSAELRFGLGSALLAKQQVDEAIEHLQRCVEMKPAYSAGWKLLGRAQQQQGDREAAILSYQRGIEAAEAQGDVQAQKEMRVFLKRLQ